MTSKAIQGQMLEYLESRLKDCGEEVEAVSSIIVPGMKSNFVRVGKEGLVLSIDRPYSGDILQRIYNGMSRAGAKNIAFVFLKDGKNFFRSAVAGEDGKAGLANVRFKKERRLSLKHYTDEELGKMITFRPEERYVSGMKGNTLQYYQPASDMLNEGLETFVFEPVTFNYSHIPDNGFVKGNEDSLRLHLWKKRYHNTDSLMLTGGYLKQAPNAIAPTYEKLRSMDDNAQD